MHYFGEKIGLYFEFSNHIKTEVLHMTIVLTMVFILVWLAGSSLRGDGTFLRMILITIWSTYLHVSWKRRERLYRVQHGNFE